MTQLKKVIKITILQTKNNIQLELFFLSNVRIIVVQGVIFD